MAKCLYNGIELPALPEWDKTVYPYAVIHVVTSVNTKLSAVLHVFTAIGYGIVNETTGAWGIVTDGKSMEANAPYDLTTGAAGAWGEWVVETDAYMANTAIDWANFDVLNEDGTLYLAASDPVPVGTAPVIEPLSMWMGWKAGNWVARQRGKKVEEEKTPVAYLYNGERLPDINAVWTDKETYPYAAVVSMFQDFYALCIAGDIPTTGHNDTFGSTLVLEVGTEAKTYILATTQEVANILGISEANVWTWDEDFPTKEGEYLCTIDQVTWASHDVLNEDGTTFLAASEPVPVYE